MTTYDDLTPTERADLFAALIGTDQLEQILAGATTTPDTRTKD